MTRHRQREERLGMHVVVDLNRCQGYAQCAFLAPRVFTMHGEESLLYTPVAPDDQQERVQRAVAACPVQAILVGEEAGAGAR
ncbi:ferredoxin [Streptomyces auratus]